MALRRADVAKKVEEFGSGAITADELSDWVFKSHGETVASVKSGYSRFDNIDVDELTAAADAYKGVQSKLNGRSVDDVLKAADELKNFQDKLSGRTLDELISQNADFAKRIEEIDHKSVVDAALSGLKFTSKAAERAIREELMWQPLTEDKKAIENQEEVLKKILEDNRDAVVQQSGLSGAITKATNLPRFSSNTTAPAQSSKPMDEQERYILNKYGNM